LLVEQANIPGQIMESMLVAILRNATMHPPCTNEAERGKGQNALKSETESVPNPTQTQAPYHEPCSGSLAWLLMRIYKCVRSVNDGDDGNLVRDRM
jgi:hypothetical protein